MTVCFPQIEKKTFIWLVTSYFKFRDTFSKENVNWSRNRKTYYCNRCLENVGKNWSLLNIKAVGTNKKKIKEFAITRECHEKFF